MSIDRMFEDTVRNLLRMKPKPHKEKGKAQDADDDKGDQTHKEPDRPRQSSDDG